MSACGCPSSLVLCPLLGVLFVVPVGGVPGGLIVLLLRVLGGVSWRVLDGVFFGGLACCVWLRVVVFSLRPLCVFLGCDCFLVMVACNNFLCSVLFWDGSWLWLFCVGCNVFSCCCLFCAGVRAGRFFVMFEGMLRIVVGGSL